MQFTFLLSTIFLSLCSFVLAKKDFYQILGVDKDALDREIKLAYRQLTLKYHPDKNPGDDEAHDKFIEIGEAYEVLSDSTKRLNYDRFGDPEGQPQHHGFDFGDMFGNFFGGHGHGAGHGHGNGGLKRGANTQLDLNMGLKDFFNGRTVPFDVEMLNDCEKCLGTGSADGKRHVCSKCNGLGQITVHHQLAPGFAQQLRMVCDLCGGTGKTIASPCQSCSGAGAVRGKRHYDVYVHPGQPRGSRVVKEGEGDRNPQWVPGDLIIVFKEKLVESWGYRRVGDNLYRTEAVLMEEALNGGWERTIPFLGEDPDGDQDEEGVTKLTLKRQLGEGILDGEVEIIKGKGMPIMVEHDEEERFGDLFIEYKVIMAGGASPGSGNKSKKSKVVEKDEL